MLTLQLVLVVLGWINVILIPLLIFIVIASHGLRSAIKESLKDGKINDAELKKILLEANRFVKALAKYLLQFEMNGMK